MSLTVPIGMTILPWAMGHPLKYVNALTTYEQLWYILEVTENQGEYQYDEENRSLSDGSRKSLQARINYIQTLYYLL